MASNAYYQLNFYGSAKPAKGWDISGGPDVQYIVRRSPSLGIERRGFAAGINLNSSYKLPKNFTIQGFTCTASLPSARFAGHRARPTSTTRWASKRPSSKRQGRRGAEHRRSPFNDYLGSTATPPTTPFFRAKPTATTAPTNAAFRLSFNYRFGQAQQGKQRKSVSNDDVKGGGSKQGGQ